MLYDDGVYVPTAHAYIGSGAVSLRLLPVFLFVIAAALGRCEISFTAAEEEAIWKRAAEKKADEMSSDEEFVEDVIEAYRTKNESDVRAAAIDQYVKRIHSNSELYLGFEFQT